MIPNRPWASIPIFTLLAHTRSRLLTPLILFQLPYLHYLHHPRHSNKHPPKASTTFRSLTDLHPRPYLQTFTKILNLIDLLLCNYPLMWLFIIHSFFFFFNFTSNFMLHFLIKCKFFFFHFIFGNAAFLKYKG